MGNDVFRALAHPARRHIVERLARGPATVGQATEGLTVSKPVISKHIKVLEDEGLIEREVVGRTHRLTLRRDRFDEVARWVERQRALWSQALDVVGEHLAATRRHGDGLDDGLDDGEPATRTPAAAHHDEEER